MKDCVHLICRTIVKMEKACFTNCEKTSRKKFTNIPLKNFIPEVQLEIDLDSNAFELTIEPSMGATYNEYWSHTDINGKCEAHFNLQGLEFFPQMTARMIAEFRDYPEEVI